MFRMLKVGVSEVVASWKKVDVRWQGFFLFFASGLSVFCPSFSWGSSRRLYVMFQRYLTGGTVVELQLEFRVPACSWLHGPLEPPLKAVMSTMTHLQYRSKLSQNIATTVVESRVLPSGHDSSTRHGMTPCSAAVVSPGQPRYHVLQVVSFDSFHRRAQVQIR